MENFEKKPVEPPEVIKKLIANKVKETLTGRKSMTWEEFNKMQREIMTSKENMMAANTDDPEKAARYFTENEGAEYLRENFGHLVVRDKK